MADQPSEVGKGLHVARAEGTGENELPGLRAVGEPHAAIPATMTAKRPKSSPAQIVIHTSPAYGQAHLAILTVGGDRYFLGALALSCHVLQHAFPSPAGGRGTRGQSWGTCRGALSSRRRPPSSSAAPCRPPHPPHRPPWQAAATSPRRRADAPAPPPGPGTSWPASSHVPRGWSPPIAHRGSLPPAPARCNTPPAGRSWRTASRRPSRRRRSRPRREPARRRPIW